MENKQRINTEKLSYEELSNVCNQLDTKCRQLSQQLYQLQQSQALLRLEFLFKIIDKKDSFDNDFVDNCINEIKEIMTIKEESEVKEEIKENKESVNESSNEVAGCKRFIAE